MEASLVLVPAFSLFLPFPLLTLCLNWPSPAPSEHFSRRWSCDVPQSVSGELSVYLRPSRQGSSRVHALLCLNWWNVRALMRIFGVCACVLNVCVPCICACLIVVLCVNVFGRMSTYWISVDPTVSKNICPGVFSLVLSLLGSTCFTHCWSLF